jgi:hypothetical protein
MNAPLVHQDHQGHQENKALQGHRDLQESVPANAKASWFLKIILLLAMITTSVSIVTDLLLLHYLKSVPTAVRSS